MTEVLLANAGLIGLCMIGLWLFSVWREDVSWIDPFWPAGFVLIAWNTWRLQTPAAPLATLPDAALPTASGELSPLEIIYLAAVSLWGIRLAGHLLARKFRHAGEDYRYLSMRQQAPGSFWLRSLGTVFALQGGLMWIISLPIALGLVQAVRGPVADSGWEKVAGVLGGSAWLMGFAWEAISDHQLTQFQRDPRQRGQVLRTGLWRYSRHPNYFGECCVWWGFYGLTCSVDWQLAWTIFSPLLVTYLLLHVSGVGLLEKTIHKRRPGYAEYARVTSAFIPWWPRSS